MSKKFFEKQLKSKNEATCIHRSSKIKLFSYEKWLFFSTINSQDKKTNQVHLVCTSYTHPLGLERIKEN